MLWIPDSYVTLFWFMFGTIVFFIYIYVVYISLNPRTSQHCNCGRAPKLIVGSMRYFARTSLAGPVWLVIITSILFLVRISNAWFIGYHLQMDTHVYDSDHVTAFVMHSCSEMLFILFFLVLFTTSSDFFRYFWLFIFQSGQYAMFIIMCIVVTTFHPETFYCAIGNIVWLSILSVVVFARELVNNGICDTKSSKNLTPGRRLDSLQDQSPSAFATPAYSVSPSPDTGPGFRSPASESVSSQATIASSSYESTTRRQRNRMSDDESSVRIVDGDPETVNV